MIFRHCNAGGRLADDRGTTAIEFAILTPLMVMLLVGIASLSLMLFALGSMHYAVEDAARCASARPMQCNSPSAIIAYAQSRYAGTLASPVFTYTAASCGNQVTATVTFTFDAGMYRQSVPLAAIACFPS
jgi:Flp pilus assembly protein TadG